MSVQIFTPENCYEKIITSYETGHQKGTTTYNDFVDECWKWREKEANILSGFNNEGKSAWFRQMALIKALEEGKKFIFCSPEDYPPDEFFLDCIHTITGQSTDKDNPNYVGRDKLDKAYNLIKDKFRFLYIEPPDNTVAKVLKEFKTISEEEDIFSSIIDPLIKFARPKDVENRDDIYAAHLGSICTDYCRTYNQSFFLTVHQVTPKREPGSKQYPEPDVYLARGGGVFADSFDNFLTVWRPNYYSDKLDPTVQFASKKIKKHKLVAIPQKMTCGFDRKTNRYIHLDNGEPLWDFDKFMEPVKTRVFLN